MPNAIMQQIIELGRLLHARNLLAAGDGNISALMPNSDTIVITPSGRSKIFLAAEDLARVCLSSGEVIAGNPSSERLLHQAIYQKCKSARWVIHAHPPTAVAWALAHPNADSLPAEFLAEVILAAGHIPIAPFALPGTPDLPASISPFLPKHRLILLARHGAVAWGENAEEVYSGMERIEHCAQILRDAFLLGQPTPLSPDDIAALRAIRSGIGDRLI